MTALHKREIINSKYSQEPNSYFLPTSALYITIALQKTFLRAKIDLSQYKRVLLYKWYLTQFGHAYANNNGKFLYLHNLVTDFPKGLNPDHINNDKLDCTSVNLRPATQQQNTRNRKAQKGATSRYKGVFIRPTLYKGDKYCVSIFYQNRKISLGTFNNELDAARAYNKAAKKYFGEFANLNII